MLFDSSFSGQTGRHFTDDIVKFIVINENACILIRISLKFVLKSSIGNISIL